MFVINVSIARRFVFAIAVGDRDRHTAGGAPQRRRTRHSGVDVMEALDDPDIMLRSDPNLPAKVTSQVRHSCYSRSVVP